MDDKEILEKLKKQNQARIQAMKQLRDEVSQLQKRTAVQAQQMKKIEDLQNQVVKLEKDIEDLKEDRISGIEQFQNKLIGGLTLSHILLGLLWIFL